jgi:hypothetical protein
MIIIQNNEYKNFSLNLKSSSIYLYDFDSNLGLVQLKIHSDKPSKIKLRKINI